MIMVEQEVKLMKPRITLKSIFRTTPESRREYVSSVKKYNVELLEEARKRKLAMEEQAKIQSEWEKSLSDFYKAYSSPRRETITTVEYIEVKPDIITNETKNLSSRSRSPSTRISERYAPIVNIKPMFTTKPKDTKYSSFFVSEPKKTTSTIPSYLRMNIFR